MILVIFTTENNLRDACSPKLLCNLYILDLMARVDYCCDVAKINVTNSNLLFTAR